MLRHIDPILCPDLLKALAQMGHEDAIVLADANFTAQRFAQHTTHQQIIRLPGISLRQAARAVLSVLPLAVPSECPVAYMHATELEAGRVNPAQQGVLDLLQAQPHTAHLVARAYERFAFYEAAKRAFVIVQTGELAPYANFIFKKGVLTHDDWALDA